MKTRRSTSLTLALAIAALAPAAASAKHGADDPASAFDDHGGQRADSAKGGAAGKRAIGDCTGRSHSKLEVKADGSRIETEFEVDENRSGVRWTVAINHDGRRAVTTHATTRAPSGSFSVERRLANRSGTDRISARATSPTGEVCTAAISI